MAKKSKQLAMDLVSVVSEEQSEASHQEAQKEPEVIEELEPVYDSGVETSDYAVLGIGVAVAAGLLGLITLLARTRRPIKPTDPLP